MSQMTSPYGEHEQVLQPSAAGKESPGWWVWPWYVHSNEDQIPRGSGSRRGSATRKDLDEALTLATRCVFRLHECDAHLGLALAEGNATQARDHLARAHEIITATGYHRRDEELATLEAEAAQMDHRPG